uniref:Uncharacterized protein n=3 Tax=Oryza TaxID=4527 RepID=A0A0D3EJE6_9ORYZ
MCLPFSSCFGGKNELDFGETSRDPDYHPLSTTPSGNSYQGGDATETRYAYQQQRKPAAAPSTDGSAKPPPLAAAGWSNNKVAHHA